MSTNSTESIDPILEFKHQFHRSKRYLALNNAGSSPWPRATLVSLDVWARKFFEDGAFAVWDAFDEVTRSRGTIAHFLGASSDELIFFQNTSEALSQVAFGLELKPGDEVITWDQEYPSNFYPWQVAAERAGAKLILAESGPSLETPLENIISKVTPRTKAIVVSWVQFRTGAVTDLKKLTDFARAKGIFTCADIIQGAGVLPFDFQELGLDAACCGSHKWLLSPHGVGLLLLRQEHLERFQPLQIGAITFGTPDDAPSLDAKMRSGVKRFEPGTQPMLNIIAMGASVELLRKTGIDRIAQEAEWLARKLMHGLRERGYIINSPHGAHFRGAIVNFSPGPDAPLKTMETLEARLNDKRVAFAAKRRPGLRLSPHAFNTAEEIDLAVEILSR